MTRQAVLAVLLVLAIAGTLIGALHWRKAHHHAVMGPVPTATYDPTAYDTHAPEGARVKVEILNATKVRGLARRATLYLRDRGFDVVLIGTTRLQQDSTLVLDRSHHPDWAALLAKTMHAHVAERPDTSLYLDATVLIGNDWTPPAEPFYP